MACLGRKVAAVLLDVTGVLYESGPGGGKPIPGSPGAVERLKDSGVKLRFCTNETNITRNSLVEKLKRHGFSLTEEEVHSPAPACCKYLRENNLRPFLLVHPDAMPDYQGVDCSNPNCVVLGDATDAFTYDRLNEAFRLLVEQENKAAGSAVLISLGKGRYYKDGGQLALDVGPFTRALEFAAGVTAVVIGKPSPTFYASALEDLRTPPENAVMIGDDLVNDVGGAKRCGMAGILVRTGKYRPADEQNDKVKPDRIADNLSEAVAMIL